MSDRRETYVYESPDRGHTVYRRVSGQTQRELVSVSEELLQKQEIDALWTKWMAILRASRDDPALKDLIQRAETYYHLKSQP